MLLESTLLSNWLFGWVASGKIPSKDLKKTAYRHTNQTNTLLNAAPTTYHVYIDIEIVEARCWYVVAHSFICWLSCALSHNIIYNTHTVIPWFCVALLHFASLLQFYFQIQPIFHCCLLSFAYAFAHSHSTIFFLFFLLNYVLCSLK